MNWYSVLKTSAPYSDNICPRCTNEILVDFYEEEIGLRDFVLGRCPVCKSLLKIQPIRTDATLGLIFSLITPISSSKYNDYRKEGFPCVEVFVDKEFA